jgi:hypothetical protein
LPFAERVDIYLKGRALPSFYAVKLPGMTFLLGLTGWSGSGFTGTGGFDLLADAAASDDSHLAPALALLRDRYHISVEQLAAALNVDKTVASRVLVRLCRQGRAMFDVEALDYRHRELFETPADESKYFPPDRRQELATELVAAGKVNVNSCVVEETRKVRSFRDPATGEKKSKIVREIIYRDWRVIGEVAGEKPVEIAINDNGRIIFGRCSCQHFAEHLLNQGPCEHMLALFKASEALRVDQPSSLASERVPEVTRKQPNRYEIDSNDGNE